MLAFRLPWHVISTVFLGANVVVGAGILPVVVVMVINLDLTENWSGGIVEQPNKKRDRARDVNERVNTVNPEQESGVLQEESLDLEFVEDVQMLLESNDLKGVSTGDFDGTGGHGDGGESAAELVDLDAGVSVNSGIGQAGVGNEIEGWQALTQ